MDQFQKGKAIVTAILIVIAMAVASAVTYLAATKLGAPAKEASVAVQPPAAQPNAEQKTQPDVAPADNSIQAVSGTAGIFKDDTVKYETPKEANFKIFKGNNQPPYKIWEIGTLKVDSSKIYLAVIDNQDPGGPSLMRFVQSGSGDNLQLRLLSKYSSRGVGDYEWDVSVVTGADNWTSIPSLDFSGVTTGPKGVSLKKEEDFPIGDFMEGEKNGLDAVFFDNAKAKLNLSPKAFYSDPTLGDFFAGNNGGLYVKAPDGTFKIYSMMVDLGGDIPKITWSDGTQNASKYSYKTEAGCGAADYLADVSSKVSSDGLAQVGTASNGNAIFGYKDPNDKALKDFYAEYQKLIKDGNMYSRYYPDEKPKNLTYDQFLQTHPIFFWKDPFGRTIQFVNLHYIFTGGCGKPVIYLYPEQSTQVSVKVTPTGGMSVSDPAYDGGWNVVADPMSHIKNLADGKTYPYLFWEGQGDSIYQMPTRGFVVSRNGLRDLLNEKLSLLGLNSKEIADFKDFWLSKMLSENKPFYFVTFVSRQAIDKLAPLEINPKPDTIIRVLMDYKGLDKYESVPDFEIKTPEREGFTAVEWGGVLK